MLLFLPGSSDIYDCEYSNEPIEATEHCLDTMGKCLKPVLPSTARFFLFLKMHESAGFGQGFIGDVSGGGMNCVSCDICVYHLGLCVFFPGVFLKAPE